MASVRIGLPDCTSTTMSLFLPCENTEKANFLESGENDPADSRKLNSSISLLVSLLPSFRIRLPVWASARYKSILNKSCSERYTIYLPSFVMDRDKLIYHTLLVFTKLTPIGLVVVSFPKLRYPCSMLFFQSVDIVCES